jgi:UPF0755 protein
MKKLILYLFLLALIAGGIAAGVFLGKGTAFEEKSRYVVIEEGKTDKASVTKALEDNGIIKYGTAFGLLGSQMHIWEKIKWGKYEVKKGQSLLDIARMLRNGKLAEIKLVINKVRTKEDLARLIGKNFYADSATVLNFLNNDDSLNRFGVTSSTAFTFMVPDTYIFYWNTPLSKMFTRIYDASTKFWQTNNRKQKAESLGFTPREVYIIASIVEEETNAAEDKGKIASVYMNRMAKGMPLQADPTIRFALNDFAMNRVYEKHTRVPSPYNTYLNRGLPPGPICTPSAKTIDAVLDAPKTDYLYFVAKPDLKGGSNFAANYAEHLKYAKAYQQAIEAYLQRKQQNAVQP